MFRVAVHSAICNGLESSVLSLCDDTESAVLCTSHQCQFACCLYGLDEARSGAHFSRFSFQRISVPSATWEFPVAAITR